MNDKKTIKATELSVGDYFSYVGSFKVYQVTHAPRRSNAFKNKIVVVVTDGDRNTAMGCRLNHDMKCQLHDSFGDRAVR